MPRLTSNWPSEPSQRSFPDAATMSGLSFDVGWSTRLRSNSRTQPLTLREYAVELDLQYNRARCFDPQVGRWLREKLLGFDASVANLYRYPNSSSSGESS